MGMVDILERTIGAVQLVHVHVDVYRWRKEQMIDELKLSKKHFLFESAETFSTEFYRTHTVLFLVSAFPLWSNW